MPKQTKKVLFTATVDSHILAFHLPFLKWFKEQGYEVHVATNGDEEIPYCDKKIKISFERSPFKLNNIKAIFQLKKVLLKEKYDIIHTHTPMGSVVTRLAAKKARKQGTRVIYTAHGFHFYKGAPLLNWCLFYPVEKYLSKYTDTLILINKEDYSLATKKFKKCKDIEYVPGVGIDEKKFDVKMTKEDKHKLRKELGLKDTDFVMIYPAELNKNKNQIMLIDAMEQLIDKCPDIHLLLPGKDSYNGYYQKIVEEKNLDKNIHFLGFRKDIPRLLKISDLSVATSKREGLPVNILEAIYVGLPIIATNCRGQRDLVKDGENGFLINLNDVNKLSLAIIKIKKNYSEAKEKAMKVNCEFIKQYKLDCIIKKMKKIYNPYTSDKPIRILQIIGSMNIGGAENFLMNIYRKIDKKKIQFDFIVHKKGIFDDEIKRMGGKIYYIKPIQEVGPIIYKKELEQIFTCQAYKIVHSHIDQVSGFILKVAYKCNVPTRIAHSHSTKNSNSFFGKIYKKYLQSKINKYSTKRFACSEEAGKWLYKNANYEIINNGIDINNFSYNEKFRKELRKKYKIPENALVVGHVGRFMEAKNHDYLVDIFNEYHKKINKNSMLLLIGEGKLKKGIIEKLDKLGLTNDTIFLERLTDVYKYYNVMDIFVFPSIYEGLPLTVIEAQINGLKCLVSQNVTKQSQITDNCKFLDIDVPPEEWAKEIILSRKRPINLKEKNIMNFDSQNIANKLCDYYIENN